MITSVTRDARKIALSCDGERRIHLTPERAESFAIALLSSLRVTGHAKQIVLDEPRSAGYRLLVVACPETQEIAVANIGPYGDSYAGWPYTEAREAAAELLRVALDITRMPERKKRAA